MCFQQFGTVSYALVGADSGSNFFTIDQSSGQVRLTSTISNDFNTVYRVTYSLIFFLSSFYEMHFLTDIGFTCSSDSINIVFVVLQLLVQAYDNGYPALYDTTVLTVNVNRNLLAPTFNQPNYNVTILESQTLGDTIVSVVATDPDSLVRNGGGSSQIVSDSNSCYLLQSL